MAKKSFIAYEGEEYTKEKALKARADYIKRCKGGSYYD